MATSTKRHSKRSVAIAVFVIIIVLIGTAAAFINDFFSAKPNWNTTAFSSVNDGLQLSMALQANKTTFPQGQLINLTFALTNVSNQTKNVTLINANPRIFYFQIYNTKNNQVYISQSGIFPPINQTITLAPNQNYTNTQTWDQGIFQWVGSSHVPTGAYRIQGNVEAQNLYSFQTEPLNITITNP